MDAGADAKESTVAQCVGLVREGPTVAEVGVAGTPPPAVGGNIVAGKYFLTKWETYGVAPGPTGESRSTSLIISATTFQFAGRDVEENIDLPFRAETYTKSGTALVDGLEICPNKDFPSTRGYTATPTSFTFVESFTLLTRVLTYTKQ